MKFEDSKFFKSLHCYKIEKPFGNFYFLDKLIVSELNESVHFDWDLIQNIMADAVDYYGKDAQLGYISNRVNSYSMDPHTWNQVLDEYNMLVAGAIVTYNSMTFMNATLEKRFSKNSIKRCLSLEEAMEWTLNLKELN
ncbi:hypothetical protein L3X39_04905 [Sabulilitoribacter multivorans]|uniref:STAS/SEC14 domain-containing protein n=1 Tax=Flaviramulus multivorans TaxID=1304750 RepID=A0ABS9IHC8_9FLAO|nr:hypothetical protein [Flaviramulus multivorans]MCF7559968.1 hypothetical protein [Flaviramulus multivorans]